MITTSSKQLVTYINHIRDINSDTILKTNKENKLDIIGQNKYGAKVYIKTEIKTDDHFYIAVDTAKLLQVLKRVSNDISLTIKDNQLCINSRFSLPIAKQFIQLKINKPDNLLEITSGELYELIQKTYFIIPNESYNEGLTNLYFEFSDNLIVSSSDGFAISYLELPYAGIEGKYLLPLQAVTSIRDIIRKLPPDENLKLGFNQSHVMLRFNEIFYISPLSNNSYPDFKAIINKISNTELYSLNCKVFLDSLEDVMSVLDESDMVEFNPGLIIKTTSENKTGRAQAKIEFKHDLGNFILQGKRLQSILKTIKDDTVFIGRESNLVILKTSDTIYVLVEMQV